MATDESTPSQLAYTIVTDDWDSLPDFQERPKTDVQPRVCAVEGCSASHYGKGYCMTHYNRWKTHGDPLWQPVSRTEQRRKRRQERRDSGLCPECGSHVEPGRTRCARCLEQHRASAARSAEAERGVCSVPDCGRPVGHNGLCQTHYHQKWREERVQRGVCMRCGKHEPEPGKKMCLGCLETASIRNREPANPPNERPTICLAPDCDRTPKSKGYCD
jgi:hypothetical protein